MSDQTPLPPPQEEPSVLDWFKAIFSRRPVPPIPELPPDAQAVRVKPPTAKETGEGQGEALPWQFPWRAISALGLALFAQFALQPAIKNSFTGAVLYGAAIGMAVWAVLRGDLLLPPHKLRMEKSDPLTVRAVPLGVGIFFSVVAFVAFGKIKFFFITLGKSEFTTVNVLIWMAGFIYIIWAIWLPNSEVTPWYKKVLPFLRQEDWRPLISRWTILFTAVLGVSIFFRLHQLGAVAPEMISDHLEKLYDVMDVLDGKTSIFFPRNTGREGLQMYLIAGTIKLFNTGISFLSMKIGTIALGLFMLPYMYLLGKEVGNRWTGMLAMLLTGIAFWPNILARVALRFILYPVFTAPVLYHLFRGIRTANRNHFVAAGIFLGLGLHGYTPFRIVPFLVVVAVGLYLLHERSPQARKQVIVWLGLLALTALIIFLPLLRYWMDNPVTFNYRLFSRMTTPEGGLPESAGLVFLKNLWVGLVMPIWSGGNIWVTTVINKPILDLVSGAMYVLGMGLLVARYIRQRNWRDITLLLAVPILMLPSTMALAYPLEIPAPNRAGGALVVIFIISAMALETLLRGIKEVMGGTPGKRVAVAAGVVLILMAATQNYDLTFDKFRTQYLSNAWNTSELGSVIKTFTLTVGDPDSAWVVAFPYWVDTRLVGINAGYPTKDYAIWPDEIESTLDYPAPKLFLVKPEDPVALEVLRETYPNGASSLHVSDVLYKDFYIYFVPADEPVGIEPTGNDG
jgi:hypothetical protein